MSTKLLICICKNKVSSNAYSCPHCGYKLRSTPINIWAKIMIGLFVVFIVLPSALVIFMVVLAGMVSVGAEKEMKARNANLANTTISQPRSNTNLSK
jgi:hypothetical protein